VPVLDAAKTYCACTQVALLLAGSYRDSNSVARGGIASSIQARSLRQGSIALMLN
jgi:hypothetical protein